MTRVLVPVAVLEGETVSTGLVDLLRTVDVTVLGYHVLPEQTPPDQARRQYEDRATDALADLCGEFRAVGGDADHRLVFTRDWEQTVDRVADEVGATALVVSGVVGNVGQLLVSLSAEVATDQTLAFVTSLVGDRDIEVTLFLAGDGDDEDAAAERLRDGGLDVQTVSADGPPLEALVEEIPGHDAVVIGEQAPSFRSLVFGEESDRVAAASVGPVLVVRSGE